MIKSITITNYLGEKTTMVLKNPETSGFFVRSVEGLGPSKATINATQLATTDGSIFNSARAGSRNIVFSIGFLGSPSIEATRHKAYKVFSVKNQVKITIETDIRTVDTFGFIESNEPNIFSDDEGSVVSVICPDPYFYSNASNVTIFDVSTALFEFPFSNESVTEKLIEFGNIVLDTERSLSYPGDIPVGVIITVHAIGDVSNFRIVNTRTRGSFGIIDQRLIDLTGHGIIEGDDIIISTMVGSKMITLLRQGVTYNILNSLDRDTDWFQLQRGENYFTCLTDYGPANYHLMMENLIAYEGV